MSSRDTVLALCLGSILFHPGGAAGEQWPETAPFRDLHLVEGITTSNDEHSISLYWHPARFRIEYPDGRGPFEQDPVDVGELYTALSVFCRADGRAHGLSGPRPLGARLSLPMHPDAPDVYSVLHPLYWVFGLSGNEFERTPVTVELDGNHWGSQLVRRRSAYGRRRPDIEVDLPAGIVLQPLLRGAPARLLLSGTEIDVELHFGAAAHLTEAARGMQRHCRPAPAAP